VIPMKRTTNTISVSGVSCRLSLLIAGVAAVLAVSSLPFICFAERGIRFPGVVPTEGPPRQQSVQVTSLFVTYLDNDATVRLSDLGSSTYRRGSWMRILVEFATQPNWIDELRFDCHVLLRGGNGGTMLTGSVTCIYVRSGPRHMASFFIHPNTMERYGGRIEAVGVECYYQNALVSDYSIPRTTRKWWQDYSGVQDTMLPWFCTPFSREGAERYEQVKVTRQGF